jgi:hypothetical protein
MEVTVVTHTIFAMIFMYGSYWWGVKSAEKALSEVVIGSLLTGLEEEGLIKTKEDSDGELEILKPLTWENE